MKDEILQVALKHFLKHGIRDITMQKLVEILGISTKTVYKYFKNKEELIEAALHLHYAGQYQILEELSTDKRVIPLLLSVWYNATQIKYKPDNPLFQDLRYYYPELETKIDEANNIKFAKEFIHIIEKGINEGVFQDTIHPEVVIDGIYLLYNYSIRAERYKLFSVSPLELLLNTVVVYIRGFCTIKGIQQLEEHIQTFQPFSKGKMATVRSKTS